MGRFAARSSARVKHPHAIADSEKRRCELRAVILHRHPAFGESGQGQHIARIIDYDAVDPNRPTRNAGRYERAFHDRPATFWLWYVPYKIVIFASFYALYRATSRRGNLLAIATLFAIFFIPYWSFGAFPEWIHYHFDQPARIARP